MNAYLSNKLKIISLISMIMVVFIHSYNITVNFNTGNVDFQEGYNYFIQNFFKYGISRMAVPIFFCISGYLFFLKFQGSLREFIQKYQKRAKSLVLPYVLWSFWGLAFFFILQQVPQSKSFFTNDLIANYSFAKVLDTLFLNPIPYQLWFLRDLIVLVLFSPIIYLLIKHLKWIPLIVFPILWLDLFDFSFVLFLEESILFFCLGAYISIHQSSLATQKLDSNKFWILSLIWILLILANTILMQRHNNTVLAGLIHKTSIVFGIMALWSVYDLLMKHKESPGKWLLSISSFSFFLYAAHEPILTMLKKGFIFILGTSQTTSLLAYFLVPLATIFICLTMAYLLKKITPGFYHILSGGR